MKIRSLQHGSTADYASSLASGADCADGAAAPGPPA